MGAIRVCNWWDVTQSWGVRKGLAENVTVEQDQRMIRQLLRAAGAGVRRKRIPGSRSGRVSGVRAEGVCVEKEEVKEASVVRAKSRRWGAVQDEAQRGGGQFTPAF